jgi:hypothetical protein
MCGPPTWGLGVGLVTPHRKTQLVVKSYAGPRIWTDYLERHSQRKTDMRFGTWNRETGWEGVVWIHLAQDRDQWRARVSTVMNLRFPQKMENFLTS